MSYAKSLILAARPQTLSAALVPVLVAYFMALRFHADSMQSVYIIPILLAVFCIQIATNFFNDYLDFVKGSDDTKERLGPQRMTATGKLKPETVKKWALFFCTLALLAGFPLILRGGLLFLIIGLVSLAMTYLYTGTRFSLAYTGMADIFVIGFFGCLATWGTYYLLCLEHNPWTVLVGLQLGALCNILLIINNLRDCEQDKKNNKKTLIVRLGRQFGLYEYLLLNLFSFLAVFFWRFFPQPWMIFVVLLPIFVSSLFIWNWVRRTPPTRSYNKALKLSSLVYLGFALVTCWGFFVL